MENYPLLNLFWTMLIFFGFVIWFWLLISVFADNFRRRDHSGWAKAGWTVVIVLLPLLGILIYMIARPKMTEQDKEMLAQYESMQRGQPGFSPSQELERLNNLKQQGAITEEDYEKLKSQLMQ